MRNVGHIINDWLEAIYDTEDPVYQSLLSHVDGTPEADIREPQDLNIGVIASTLEYLRRYCTSLIVQMNVQEATGDFLEFMLSGFLGCMRLKGESEQEWKNRVVDQALRPKVSRAAIIYHMRPYSVIEPTVETGDMYAAYADVSYADVYASYMIDGERTYPAIASELKDTAYFFILTLVGTDPEDIPAIIDKLNNIVAAGISYELRIQ